VARGGATVPGEEVAQLAGARRRAARLFGTAEALREAIGAPLQPSEQEPYRRQVSRVQDLIGEELLAAAWAEGRAMTLDEAIDYALEASSAQSGGAQTV
jgi:hypothetical protein